MLSNRKDSTNVPSDLPKKCKTRNWLMQQLISDGLIEELNGKVKCMYERDILLVCRICNGTFQNSSNTYLDHIASHDHRTYIPKVIEGLTEEKKMKYVVSSPHLICSSLWSSCVMLVRSIIKRWPHSFLRIISLKEQ